MNYNEVLNDCIDLFDRISTEILKIYEKDFEVAYKYDESPLTEADKLSNQMIFEGLSKYKVPIFSEEDTSSTERFDSDYVFIVDPLDGTKDFINKTDEFTIMLALVKKTREVYRPVIALIYQPATKDYYYAIKDKGAYKNSKGRVKKLQVNPPEGSKKMTMLTSNNHSTQLEKQLAQKLGIDNVKKFGSSLKACMIADGKGEINCNPGPHTWEWDVCASDLLLHEAGGVFADTKGNKFSYNKNNPRNYEGYLACTKEIFDKTVAIISQLDEV